MLTDFLNSSPGYVHELSTACNFRVQAGGNKLGLQLKNYWVRMNLSSGISWAFP